MTQNNIVFWDKHLGNKSNEFAYFDEKYTDAMILTGED